VPATNSRKDKGLAVARLKGRVRRIDERTYSVKSERQWLIPRNSKRLG